jgi:hypothetical protein
MALAPQTISDIFEKRIDRPIEEVIKVDALDDAILLSEIEEYYPTPSIQTQMAQVLEAYSDLRRSPTDKVGVWVSGFFGAGKSSFAKLLGVLLGARKIGAQDSVDVFSRRITDDRIKVLLRQIREHLPTHVVIFDILKDQIAGAREHPVTTVMYRALLRSLGYPMDIDLAELEINLEEQNQLEQFRAAFSHLYNGRTWDDAKRLTMTAFNQASAALREMDAATYPSADSWVRSRLRADISPRKLAERVLALSNARAGGRHVAFVVDEVGQYTARELSRIGDLQGVVESFGMIGKGRVWLIGTSQEKLESIVDIYERDRTELVRLQDRFAHKVFLSPSDIRDVASHRVLSKNAAAEKALRSLYQEHSGKLRHCTNITGAVDLPALEEDSFVKLYPLLPYQIDLLISVVSGLRRQAGGPQTMGGANRTIIKLAQQLLIHEKVGLAGQPIGRLVTLDSVYELISTSISSEIHQEIDDIGRQVSHPFAVPVAKALALLQFAESVHATEDNIAAVLHPSVDAESVIAAVREAVDQLVKARKVRRTEQGLKIQSAAERTWDEERDSRQPTPGDRMRIIKEQLEQLWGKGAQQPTHQMGGWRRFTGGLSVGSEAFVDGDVVFEVRVIDPEKDASIQIQDARAATQSDGQLITWVIELPGNTESAIRERHRSEHMIRARAAARSKEEEALLRDEQRRLGEEKRRIADGLAKALCAGKIYFNGNDRSPSDQADDPKAEARRVLAGAVTQIYHRFDDGDVKVTSKDVEAILKSESLAGLPACYMDLGLIRTEHGQVQLVTDRGAAKEVMDWIRRRCDSASAPAGKELEQHFKGPPYGWSFELVQLLVATLLRDGQISLKAQGQQIKDARSPEARRELTNNPQVRALTVSVRESTLDPKKLRTAARSLQERFGLHCPALTAESIAAVLREHLGTDLPKLERAHQLLRDLGLPGETVIGQGLDALRIIRGQDDEDAIHSFLDSADTLVKAVPRARTIEERLTEPAQEDLRRARTAADDVGPVLEQELESDSALEALARLRDHLGKETFFEQIPPIRSDTDGVLKRFEALYETAFASRRAAYEQALADLTATPGWSELSPEDQETVASPLRSRLDKAPLDEPWREAKTVLRLLREETLAARALLDQAQQELRHILTPQAVEVKIRALLNGPIGSAEELDLALQAIREAVEKALAEGHPVSLV